MIVTLLKWHMGNHLIRYATSLVIDTDVIVRGIFKTLTNIHLLFSF